MIVKLGWMNIHQHYVYFTAILMFKCLNNLAPNYLTCKFKYVQSNTRRANGKNLIIPFPHTEMFK